MITPQNLHAAPVMQLKNWCFSIAERLRKQFHGGCDKFEPLWKIAVENVGCRSLIFGLEKWERYFEKKNLLGHAFVQACLGSLENDERRCKMFSRRMQAQVKTFIHKKILIDDFFHAGLDLTEARSEYPIEVRRMVLQFRKEQGKDMTPLLVAADFMDEMGVDFEPKHLRSGHHGLSCPLILHILKDM